MYYFIFIYYYFIFLRQRNKVLYKDSILNIANFTIEP